MRNMSVGITALVVSVGMISVGAQGRNFSGTWVIDSEKTMAAMQTAMGEMAGAVVARGGGGGGVAVGGAVARGGGGGGGGVAAGGAVVTERARSGGGGRGGAAGGVGVSSDTVITIDGTAFSTDIGGVHTSYPLNGSEVSVPVRAMARGTGAVTASEAKARASWKGDMLVIETTIDSPNGPVTSTTSWFLEGDSLVRLTTRKTYYKRK